MNLQMLHCRMIISLTRLPSLLLCHIIPVGAFRGQPLYAQALISAGEPTIYVSVSSVKSTIMPTEAISAQCSKKFIIKVYSLPYKVVFKLSFLEIFLYSLGVIPVLFLNIFIKHISFPYPQRSDISLTVISVVER